MSRRRLGEQLSGLMHLPLIVNLLELAEILFG